MSKLKSIKKVIAKVMEWICVAFVLALTILTCVAVVLRYIFGKTFIQQEELITFLFVLTVFFGTVPVMYAKEHVSVTLIEKKLPPAVQKILKIFQYVVIIVIQGLLVYASKKWIETNLNFTTPGLRIPFWTIYIALPISCTLNAAIGLIDLIEYIMKSASELGKENGA